MQERLVGEGGGQAVDDDAKEEKRRRRGMNTGSMESLLLGVGLSSSSSTVSTTFRLKRSPFPFHLWHLFILLPSFSTLFPHPRPYFPSPSSFPPKAAPVQWPNRAAPSHAQLLRSQITDTAFENS